MARPSGRKTSQFKLGNVQPAPSIPSLQNNFVGGLKTEFTGLNFPDNSCTATSNCSFTRVGNVTRRNGIDFESNAAFPQLNSGSRVSTAISNFLWENAGGDGLTVIEVVQVGGTVNFFLATNGTVALSNSQFGFVLNLSSFQVTTLDTTLECQYTTGNGYLFIFHPNCDPIYVTLVGSTLTANNIIIQIRDFTGVNDTDAISFRPPTLTALHQYNLQNQGWSSGSPWTGQWDVGSPTFSITQTVPLSGSNTFTLTSNSSVALSNGDIVNFSGPPSISYTQGGTTVAVGTFTGSGTVTAYTAGVSVTLNVTSFSDSGVAPGTYQLVNRAGGDMFINFVKVNTGFLNTWFTAEANYPSNADIWYLFKDSTGAFNPGTTQPSVAVTLGQAPQGHYVLQAFNQNRSSASGISGPTTVSTLKRPTTGAFYQGRVFYSGVNASQSPSGDIVGFVWTESIFFSQVIQSPTDFGLCYQNNDPTSQLLNALLPTDGGVITIQNSGAIYKLFPVQNGLLVFAANGIWFITGNTGIGFTANDFSVTKISGEHAISGKSFVSIQGYPIFWNADGIYMVSPGQAFQAGQRGLEVQNLTLPTIKSFYQAIPLSSKKNARGAYNHLTGEVRWLFKSTEATNTLDAYTFDSVLNFLTYTGSFYTWTLTANALSQGIPAINGIEYIEGPGGLNIATPQFFYVSSFLSGGTYLNSFAQERDQTNWTDFHSTNGNALPYSSTFTTAYQVKGEAQRKFQPMYVYLYSEIPVFSYKFQGVWDYAGDALSNKTSSRTLVNNNLSHFTKKIKKHRVRGSGYVLQYQVTSNDGKPFNFSGWAVSDIIGSM